MRWEGQSTRCAFQPVISLCPLCPLWFIVFFVGCGPREGPGAELTRGRGESEPQPYVETVPGSSVTFAMRPVSVPDGAGGARTVWFAETETTWDAYDVFSLRLDENPTNVAGAGGTPDAITRPTQPYAPADRGWGHGGYPFISVTFSAATKYCQWLTQKTGPRYRLPTREEWRAAVWAGEGATQWAKPAEWRWLADNANETTHPVAAKRPNARGLYDMVGNVAEWCTDEDGKPVVLGGSFLTPEDDLDAALIDGQRQIAEWTLGDPSFPPSKWWLRNAPFVGFRVVCQDPPK